MFKFSEVVKSTQVVMDKMLPGLVKVGVEYCDERGRYYLTGESEQRMIVTYDYDADLIRPAKKKLHKSQSVITEEIFRSPSSAASMLIGYYEQRKAHMLATDEQVLAFNGHPAMFTA